MNTARLRSFLPLLFLLAFTSLTASGQLRGPLYPVYKDRKTGYMDRQGRLVVDYQFHTGELFRDGYAVVTNGMRRGALDSTGKLVIPVQYSELDYWAGPDWWVAHTYPDSLRIFRLGSKKDIYRGRGHSAIGWPTINRLVVKSHPYSGAKEHLAVLIDYSGKKIAEVRGQPNIQWAAIEENTEGQAGRRYNRHALILWHSDYHKSLTDLNGKLLYDSVDAMHFLDGYMIVRQKERVALLDTLLRPVIPFSAGFTKMEPLYRTPYYIASKGGLSGVIDRKQAVIVPFVMKGRRRNHTDRLIEMGEQDGRHFYLYDMKGQLLVESKHPFNVTAWGTSSKPMAAVVPILKNDTTYQLWNGKFIAQEYRFISPFSKDGYAVFSDGRAVGLLDEEGRVVLPARYQQLALPVNRILAAGKRVDCPDCNYFPCAQSVSTIGESWINQFYYLDLQGRPVGKETYDFVLPFESGQAQVMKNCKSVMIDKTGRVIGSGNDYVFLSKYEQGVRIVEDSSKRQALMDRQGRIVSSWVESFDRKEGSGRSFAFFDATGHSSPNALGQEWLPKFQHGLIRFQQASRWGLMDSSGREAVPAIYRDIHTNYNHYLITTGPDSDEKMGALDSAGRLLIRPEYHSVRYAPGYFWMEKEEGGTTEVLPYP